MSEVKFKLAAGTNVGLIRQNNEDNFVVSGNLGTSEWLIPQAGDYADLGEFGALLVVADGMGGANAGEVASAIAVETIQSKFVPESLKDAVLSDKDIQKFMKTVVKAADLNILNRSTEDPSTRGMGTTIVMAWILGDKAYVCWCGDSRCYVLNKEKGLMRLSKDHSYVQELVDKGELDPQYASDHPLSNVITRCLGDVEKRANPETRIWQLHNGDTIMLCSDGLSSLCNDEEILNTLINYRDEPMICKNELISAALSNGGYDNVTIALCNIEMEEPEIPNETTVVPQVEEIPMEETAVDETPAEEESADEEEQKEEDWQGEESTQDEELSTTLPVQAKGHKSRGRIVIISLILLAAAALWFWQADQFSGPRNSLKSTINNASVTVDSVVHGITGITGNSNNK